MALRWAAAAVVLCGGVTRLDATAAVTGSFGVDLTPELQGALLGDATPSEPMGQFRTRLLRSFDRWLATDVSGSPLRQWFAQPDAGEGRPDDGHMAGFPYWRFMPHYEVQAVPGGADVSWTNWCFRNNTATVAATTADSLGLEVHVGSKRDGPCSDSYLLLTTTSLRFHTFRSAGSHMIRFALPRDPSHRYDIDRHGIRIGRLLVSPANLLKSLVATAKLFVSLATKGVPDSVAWANVDFLAKYAGRRMEKRPPPLNSVPSEDQIHSGDAFGGIRLDGLDPMLAWAMGSSTGHLATALRLEDGSLYVTESTTKDSYWPTDGIQMTPWATWIKQVQSAGYHFVWLPLRPEHRDRYNATAAAEILPRYLGTPYGFHNMLWAWLDTPADNYPCLPPTFETCLDWRVVMPALAYLDRLTHGFIGQKLWIEAFNKRLGTTHLTTAELFAAADKAGLSFADLASIPERDEWVYSDGFSRMCDAWVCTLWKAAGVVGDDFQCTETTNWDILALPLFGPPQQISGEYAMDLSGIGSKPWAPYPSYGERCGGHAPDYTRQPYC